MSKFTKTTFGSPKTILKFNDFTAIGVMVSDTGVAVVGGKKIVPAGTILGGQTKRVIDFPEEPTVKKNAADAEGVLLTDVDVTYGPASSSMVIHGFIDKTKLPEPPSVAAVTALNLIKFMN